jgi:hypothetical protein
MPLLADGYFELTISADRSFAYFVEIDLSTHSQRTWRDRAKLYTAYADPQAALYRRRFGRQTFRLLIVTKPDYRQRSRRDNILGSIQDAVGESDLFLATTFDVLNPQTMFRAIWHQPGSSRLHSILETGGGTPAVITVKPSRPT